MRSLFHFPLPCTTTLAVTVSYSNRPTAARNVPSPASCTHAPPAPLPSVAFRRPPATRAHRPPSRPPCAAAVLRVLRFAVRIAPTARRRPRSPLALRRPQGPGWQESHRMHPLLAECAKKAPFLAASARNACFSRSRWQHPRPMHPFPGAIGRFGMHGTRILPPRAHFRVEEPEITHGAKMLPAPPGLSAAAACGPAERALRHATAACGPAGRALRPAAQAWPACRMRPPLSSRLCPPRPAVRPNGLCALLSRFAVRDPPRGPRTDASRYLRAVPIPPTARTHRVQETSGTAQTTQCGHKNRIPKWRPY